MSRAALAALLAMTITAASAAQDDMQFRQDKQIHFGGSIGLGAIANLITESPWKAFAGCSAVGGVIELLPKVTGHGVASKQDFAYDVAGCAFGAFIGFKVKGLFIGPDRIIFKKEF